MTQELQQNRYDQLLRRVGGMTGPGAKVAEVIPEVFPVLDLENLPGELYLLSGTRLGYGGQSKSAAAAQFPAVQLFNPAGSGMIATVTSVLLSTLTTQDVRLSQVDVAEASDTQRQRLRDHRLGLAQETTCVIFDDSNAALLAPTVEFRLLVNTPFVLTDPDGIVILAPGTGITFSGTTAQTSLYVNFWWRERVAEQSEQNF